MAGRKPKTLTDEQRAQVEALGSDWLNCGPIVYGLMGDDQKIVYVGATKNPKRRFAYYRTTKNCHNKKLQQWLKRQKSVYVQILHKGLNGLFEAEKAEIKNRTGLFNMIAGGDQAWRENSDKPWMAGTGVLCPSSIGLRMLAMSGIGDHEIYAKQVRQLKSAMNDEERIVYKINIAKKMPHNNRVKKWLSLASKKMLSYLEGGSHAEPKEA